jgi:hypothetical protein
MKVYTYTEARQRLSSLLERARKEGGVRIRRRNGQIFLLKPERPAGSPLDVKGIDLGITKEEIVAFIRESRKIRPRG